MAGMRISRVIYAAAFLILTACAFDQSAGLSITDTPSPVPLPQGTPVPTRRRELHPIETPAPTNSATPDSRIQCDTSVENTETTHSVTAELNYVKRAVKVAQQITYTNSTGESLDTLVINVKSNWQPGIFTLQSLDLGDEQQLPYHITGQRLEINFPQPLPDTCTIHINLKFDLRLPLIDFGGFHAYQGYLGYSDRQANLGQWLPVVAVRQEKAWISHDEIAIGEQDILDIANWDVTLSIVNAPDSIRVAAPGIVEQISDNKWRFILLQARDFSLSVGENYRLLQQETASKVIVELYSFSDAILSKDTGSMDSAAYALATAVKSMNLYEALYGPYPLKRLVIVEGDFPDGMEFSGIVFVGGEYFRGLGGVESYLTIISVHEVAHQWWYARVGNDQAINPWLDEALATYSELVFIEKYYPTLTDWWWNFRVNRLLPQGFVDSTVYEFSSRRAYINAIYLRGVEMLQDLRTSLGDDVFFGWLHQYASAGAGHIMTPEQFWSFLTPQQFAKTEAIRNRYLQQPQINTIATTPS